MPSSSVIQVRSRFDCARSSKLPGVKRRDLEAPPVEHGLRRRMGQPPDQHRLVLVLPLHALVLGVEGVRVVGRVRRGVLEVGDAHDADQRSALRLRPVHDLLPELSAAHLCRSFLRRDRAAGPVPQVTGCLAIPLSLMRASAATAPWPSASTMSGLMSSSTIAAGSFSTIAAIGEDDVGGRVQVGLRAAPEAVEERRALEAVERLQDLLPRDREQEGRAVLHELDEDAAAADHEVGAELLVLGDADDDLGDDLLDHALDEERSRRGRPSWSWPT